MTDTKAKQTQNLRRKAIFSIIVALVLVVAGGIGFYLGWKQVKSPILLALNFHGVKDNPSLPWEIRYNELTSILDSLLRYDFKAISADEFSETLKTGNFVGRNFILTFDDGLVSSAEAIKKLFKEKGIKSILFVVTDFIGKESYADIATLKDLSENYGCRIGLHGKRHYEITKILSEGGDLVTEIDEAREKLAEELGKPVNWYAYPFGEYNASAVAAIGSTSFEMAFTVDGYNIDKDANLRLLPRVMYLRGGASAGAPDPLDWAPPKGARTGSLTITLACLVLFISLSWIFRGLNLLRVLKNRKE